MKMYKILLVVLMVVVGFSIPTQAQFSSKSAATADSLGVDTDGNGTIDGYLYSTIGGAFHLKKGANITFTIDTDTLTIAGATGAGTQDSIGVDTDNNGSPDTWAYGVGSRGMFSLVGGQHVTLSMVGDTATIVVSDSVGKALNDASGNVITATYLTISSASSTYLTISNAASTYETITNVTKIGDDTTNYQTAFGWGNWADGVGPFIDTTTLDTILNAHKAVEADSSSKALADASGNVITSTYETITNVAKIGDDTTNYQTAYTHSQDNAQAHTDYLINNGNDATSGTLTSTGLIIGAADVNEAELEIIDGATLTTTELNYVDGVISDIQTQLNLTPIKIDSAGDGTNVVSLSPQAVFKEGSNITFLIDPNGDTITVSGPASAGTADSLGVDTNGDGTVDNYLYSTVAGAFHIKKGTNITLTVVGDTVTIAGPASAGTADSIGVDTDGNGTVDGYMYSTVAGSAHLKEGTGMILTLDTDTTEFATTLGTSVDLTTEVTGVLPDANVADDITVTLADSSSAYNELMDTLGTKDTLVYVGTDTIIKFTRDAANDSTFMSAEGTLVIAGDGAPVIDFGDGTLFDSSYWVDIILNGLQVDTIGDGSAIDTTGPGIVFQEGTNITLSMDNDTLNISASGGSGYWDSTIVDNDSIVYQIVNVGAQGNDTLIEFIHDTSATDITYMQRTVGGRIDLKDIGEIYFDQITNGTHVEGKQWYDPEENAMTYYNNNSQMTIQLAQELIKEVRNVSGDSIPDGTPVYQVDGGVTGHKLHVAMADADDSAKSLVFGVTTTAIGTNSDGYVAVGGIVHGLNTSAYTVGDELYLDTVEGGLTTSLYDINTGGVYRVYIGQVVVSHASTGVISINVARMPAAYEIPRLDSVVAVQIEDSLNTYTDTTSNRVYFDSAMQHLDGMAYDKPAIVIAEYQTDSGLVVEVEKLGGGDMVFRLDGVNSTLDCTTGDAPGGQASVNINDGTDKYNPAGTWLYVTNSGGVATLESSGTRPTGSFCWVGYISVADTATFNDVGPYAFQRTTEAFTNNSRGTESSSREKLRALGAVYISGLVPTLTIYSTPDPDTLHLDITAGKVYQLHSQDFPAWDDGPYYYGNGDSIYAQIGDLSEVLVEQDGTSLSGTRYVLVFWGAINYSTGDCKLFVNLPSGSYSKDDPAISDAELTADFSAPEALRGQAFLIAKVVLKHTTTAGGTWTSLGDGVYDLRNTPIGVRTGGTTSGPASTEFSDVDFKIYDNVDATKEIMFEASGITAATTRTLTVPDASGTIALLADLGPFIDSTSLDTIQYAHKAVESDSTDAITDGSIDGDKLESNLKDSITTAYDHSQDATQAHSDYTRNVGDTVTGTYDFSDGNIEDVNKAIMDTVQAGVIDGGVSGATVKLPDGLTIAGDSIIDFTGTNLSVTNGVLNAAGGAGGTDSSLYVDSIMVEGNTETGITVTMNTVDTTMDFVVDADIVNHTLDTSEVITIIKDSMPPSFQGLIFSPTDLTDSLPIFDVGAKQFPGGIVIDSIQITIDADAAYSLQFMTYTNADPPVFDTWIDTVSTGATDQKAYSIVFTDGTIEVGKTVYIGIPVTDIGWIKWAVFYHRP